MSTRPITPSEVLVTKFLKPLGITQTVLAKRTGWTRKHVNQLCRGKASITVESALVLARVFNTTPQYWLTLQRDIDLWDAMHSEGWKGKLKVLQPFSIENSAV